MIQELLVNCENNNHMCVYYCRQWRQKGLLVLPTQRLWSDPAWVAPNFSVRSVPAYEATPLGHRRTKTVWHLATLCAHHRRARAKRTASPAGGQMTPSCHLTGRSPDLLRQRRQRRYLPRMWAIDAPCPRLSAPYLRVVWTLSSWGLKGCQGTPIAVSPAYLEIPLHVDGVKLIC